MNDYTLKGYLLGLMVTCPVGEPTAGCPLNTIRTRSRMEQMEYITDLSLKEAAQICNYHRGCMAERLDDSFSGYS